MCASVEGAGDIDLAEALARSPPSAASTADGKSKGKEITHSLPLSMYSAPGGLRQDPGHAAEWLAEARTYGNGGVAKCVCCCRRWARGRTSDQ